MSIPNWRSLSTSSSGWHQLEGGGTGMEGVYFVTYLGRCGRAGVDSLALGGLISPFAAAVDDRVDRVDRVDGTWVGFSFWLEGSISVVAVTVKGCADGAGPDGSSESSPDETSASCSVKSSPSKSSPTAGSSMTKPCISVMMSSTSKSISSACKSTNYQGCHSRHAKIAKYQVRSTLHLVQSCR